MKQNLSYLNKIFSKKTLFQLIQKTKTTEELNLKLNELYKEYQLLAKCYRNEYFYKNTLLNNLLFKAHNPLTTTALTEIPVSRSIADFILINGKATVYEIKTELDTFDRLDSQLSNYYKSFDNVCVVVPEKKVDILEDKLNNPNVGIYYISKRGALRKYREPLSYVLDLDYECLFKILRKSEYEKILSKYFSLPDVPQYRYYTECLHFFKKIPLDKVYLDFKYQLKQRKINSEYYSSLSQFPEFLRYLAYFSKFSKSELANLKMLFKL